MNKKGIIFELLTIIIVITFLIVGLVFGKVLLDDIINNAGFETDALDRLNSTNDAVIVLDWLPLIAMIFITIIGIITVITIDINPVFAVFGVIFLIICVIIAGQMSSFMTDSFEMDSATNSSYSELSSTKTVTTYFAPFIFVSGIILLVVMYAKGA
jgi:hypothetical protein